MYAASINTFGDKEVPITVTVKIDGTQPALTCNGVPSLRFGTHGLLSAKVTDPISGPVAPLVSTPADTSSIGPQSALLYGTSNAGMSNDIQCNYTVLPAILNPTPAMNWAFSLAGRNTTVRRLAVSDIPAQAAVNVTCKGTGRPFSAARNVTGKECGVTPCIATKARLRGGHRRIDVTPLVARVQLAAGAQLTVSVTKPNTIGRVWLFTTRAGKAPSHRISCLEPGSSRAGQGCAAAAKRGRADSA